MKSEKEILEAVEWLESVSECPRTASTLVDQHTVDRWSHYRYALKWVLKEED
jgi:hypothetical protein